MTTCIHCGRVIIQDQHLQWLDPEATGDDEIWAYTCDAHDTFVAERMTISRLHRYHFVVDLRRRGPHPGDHVRPARPRRPRPGRTRLMRVIHLSLNGRPACGYHRWSSEQITSTKNHDKVTCKRHGCVPHPTPQEVA